MNNPNPFVPQGSLLEQQSKRRSRLKLGVFCLLAVGIAGLCAMLIQGCKREEDANQTPPDMASSQPPVDTNSVAANDTNSSSMEVSNPPVAPQPVGGQQPVGVAAAPAPAPAPAPALAPAPTENEYVVVKGDTLSKIAKANGITVRTLEDANAGVTPSRLKIGQKLMIPGGGVSTTGASAASQTASGIASSTGGDTVYTVKSGDTLSRIAHHFGVTVKAIETENNLTTTHINVGKKLNIPARAEASPAPVNTPPAVVPAAPAPSAAPVSPPPAAGQQQ